MQTRGNRPNYLALNDGYQDEVPAGDWTSSLAWSPAAQGPEGPVPSSPLPSRSQSAFSANTDSFLEAFDDLLPSESASQLPTTASSSQSSILNSRQNDWMWGYLYTREFPNEWTEKRSGRKRLVDREICCTVINKNTRKQCNWSTTDSKRQTSTTNIRLYLKEKHGILPPGITDLPTGTLKSTIVSLWGNKGKLTIQELLEKNLLRWVTSSKQPFTQIFKDILGAALLFTSRYTLRQRLLEDFDLRRTTLKEELAAICQTIALSLDVWTSKNYIPILGIVGYWLIEDFVYREKVLEFTELYGLHSGENLAAAIEALLIELNLEHKLLSITGDNASNNERIALQLFQNLQKTCGTDPLFGGLGSYIRCLAHIINLIVKVILLALKSGNTEEAAAICDNLDNGEHQSFPAIEPLVKLRILSLWIHRTWKNNCKRMNLSDKFIEYDVDTRWNSTFRMLDDALKSRQQLEKFIHYETGFPPFSTKDWTRLSQLYNVLSKFNEFTFLVVLVYYELHDLLHNVAERKEDFADLDEDIVSAVRESIKKYMKYYTFMDVSDIYYTALILDPCVKGDLLLYELDDEDTGRNILQALHDDLHCKYPGTTEPVDISQPLEPSYKKQKVGSRMLRRLQP
ncbi:uncharacterized protein N7473_004274 [Penicillium subrubescens]|uniref:uncharacterized protein n=1 Tax=Penicillium subrubescens TaxID=1316194 RepID=UPI0025454E68|nr:uncharacterized protein N7473_004274 [Penicillium subrubescens]KAJ5900204.1 hypothetical protein N7473_004274 [Penicillium subrubescens]